MYLFLLVIYGGPVAQWLEQSTHNALVLGSSPSRPTIHTQFLPKFIGCSLFFRLMLFKLDRVVVSGEVW